MVKIPGKLDWKRWCNICTAVGTQVSPCREGDLGVRNSAYTPHWALFPLGDHVPL